MRRWFRRKRPARAEHPFRWNGDGPTPKAWAIFERLLRERIVLVAGPIDDQTATLVIAQLLYLAQQDATAPIRLYVNSPGGLVTSSLGIYDAMLEVTPPVATTCVGQAGGTAVLLLAAGQPGMRAAISKARVLPLRLSGAATNDELAQAERDRLHALLDELFMRHTGRSLAALNEAGPIDTAGAIALGIVDSIIEVASP
jgi:ATP-dependent Clp protease protease subunit